MPDPKEDPIGLDERWREQVRPVQRDHLRLYQILGAIAAFVVIVVIAYRATPGSNDDFILNAVTEALGVLGTVLIIGSFNAWINDRQYKADLILQMGSPDNAFAREAARKLRAKGWLQDGALQDADLRGANLHQSSLQRADLRRVHLRGANLTLADFAHADLSHAELRYANLDAASLSGTKLYGADLTLASIRRIYLSGAKFNEETILPDGTPWTPGTDMTRFTNPDHPNFYEPWWVKEHREQ